MTTERIALHASELDALLHGETVAALIARDERRRESDRLEALLADEDALLASWAIEED